MAFLKTTENSDRDSFGTPVDSSNFIQPGSKGMRGIKKGETFYGQTSTKYMYFLIKNLLTESGREKGVV